MSGNERKNTVFPQKPHNPAEAPVLLNQQPGGENHDPKRDQTRSKSPQAQIRRALAVVRLRRAAREFCDEWEATREEKKPTPNPVETDQWFYIRGFRLKGHHFFMDYINRCKKTKEDPLPMDIVRGLMPWRSCHRIIENLIHRGSSYERRLGHNGPISPRDLAAFPIMTWNPHNLVPIPA